ncbi:hypothetical protein ACVIWU_003109 [Bradyrhizobium sp. USDA 4509]
MLRRVGSWTARLDAIPEGWAVSLMQRQLTAEHISMLNMMLGEARRLGMS